MASPVMTVDANAQMQILRWCFYQPKSWEIEITQSFSGFMLDIKNKQGTFVALTDLDLRTGC